MRQSSKANHDEDKINLSTLLKTLKIIDPTTLNQQGSQTEEVNIERIYF